LPRQGAFPPYPPTYHRQQLFECTGEALVRFFCLLHLFLSFTLSWFFWSRDSPPVSSLFYQFRSFWLLFFVVSMTCLERDAPFSRRPPPLCLVLHRKKETALPHSASLFFSLPAFSKFRFFLKAFSVSPGRSPNHRQDPPPPLSSFRFFSHTFALFTKSALFPYSLTLTSPTAPPYSLLPEKLRKRNLGG